MQSAGGEDTAVETEYELMRSKGHDVMVHFFDNAKVVSGFAGKLRSGISAIYNTTSAQQIKTVIRSFKPDIVHLHNFFFAASPSVIIAVHEVQVPLVVTIHNYRLICTNSLLLRNNKICELCVNLDFAWYGVKYKCYHHSAIQSAMVATMAATHKWSGTWKNKVDLYFTPASFSREKLLHSSLNIPAHKIEVKPNFIPDPGEGDISKRENFFLFVGRLAEEKGVEILLESWKHSNSDTLMIVGDGPEHNRLIQQYGHLNNVSFIGKRERDQTLALMKRCRALIFPSIWYEGLPMTIIESFATGTPVIGSRLGAMNEMITHHQNGLLFEAGIATSLTEAVQEFNAKLRSNDVTMYQNARNTYLEYYHPDICYEKTMNFYKRVIRSKLNGGKI